MKIKRVIIGFITIIILISIAMIIAINAKNKSNSADIVQENQVTEENEKSVIKESTNLFAITEESAAYSNYDAKINLSDLSYDGKGVSIDDKTITIKNAGVYYLSGSTTNANIIIETTKDDEVVLVLDNVDMNSSNKSAINVQKAKQVIINVPNGSNNIIADGTEHLDLNEDGEPDGAIFSKSDLKFTGSGSLNLTGNYKDGIVSKDTLTIVDIKITIKSNDDGIRGKDYVAIKNADISVDSIGDGIKSTNDSDDSLGYIIFNGGKLKINAEADGIQATNIINISDCDIDITTTGEISKSNVQSDVSSSSKGLKAGREITINSGNIKISSTDDAIHSNYFIIINNGTFDLSTGDDALHADTNIIVNNGTINIRKSYEGIESNYIEINGGKINVISSDDGINVSGGADSSGMGRYGQDNFSKVNTSNRKLVINGGDIYVDAQGDGLDSNGSIEMYGGSVIVVGTTSGGNGALDYDSTFNINGGSLIAYGATGMWQNPSNSSKQYSICFSASGKSGDELILKDSSGTEVASIKSTKTYSAIVFSNDKLKQDETYTLYVNGVSYRSQQLTEIVTSELVGNGIGGRPKESRGEEMKDKEIMDSEDRMVNDPNIPYTEKNEDGAKGKVRQKRIEYPPNGQT